MSNCKVTDRGLEHFRMCKKLGAVGLEDMAISDASLEILSGFPNLKGHLFIRNTRFSQYGYEQLKAGNRNVDWSEPNRIVAERVLAQGGTVEIGPPGKEGRTLKPGDPLPKEFFQVRRLTLQKTDGWRLDGKIYENLILLNFPDFDRLEGLSFTNLGGSLDFLLKLPDLQDLSLVNSNRQDDLLNIVSQLVKLRRLVLDGNPLKGTTLAQLEKLPDLTELSLACPSLTDFSVRNLSGLKKLQRLSLAGSALTEKGLAPLKGLTNLRELDLRGTLVNEPATAELKQALPQCKILTGPLEGKK